MKANVWINLCFEALLVLHPETKRLSQGERVWAHTVVNAASIFTFRRLSGPQQDRTQLMMLTLRDGDKINFNYSHVKLDFLRALGDWGKVSRFWPGHFFFNPTVTATRAPLVAAMFQQPLCRQDYEISHSCQTDVLSHGAARRVLMLMITGCIFSQQVTQTPFYDPFRHFLSHSQINETLRCLQLLKIKLMISEDGDQSCDDTGRFQELCHSSLVIFASAAALRHTNAPQDPLRTTNC